jgi:glycosyltransferase involved in cell wall biosynthesis
VSGDPPVEVLVDARIDANRAGGMQQFIAGVAAGFARLDRADVRWTFVTLGSDVDWLPVEGARTSVIRLTPRHPTLRRLARPLRRRGQPGRLAGPPTSLEGFDVAHMMTQQGFDTTVPAIYHPYDLQHRHLDALPASERADRDIRYSTLARRSTVTVAMTAWGAQDLRQWLGASAPPLAVVRPGPRDPRSAGPTPDLRLPERYVVYPARPFRHKNHRRLLDAFARPEVPTDLHLVLTGTGPGDDRSLVDQARRLGLEERVHWLGFVPEATVDAVLASATGLVFPSLFEGWGMPVTDALAVGLPVACSDLPVLREVAGAGADYFDPTDPAAIAAAIARLARPGRRDVGPATSAMSLSWDEAAHRLVALQRWAAGRSVLDHDHTALLAGFVDGGHDEVPRRVGGAGRDRIA